MNIRNRISPLYFSFLLLSILIGSCTKTAQVPVFNTEFIHYISAYTSGVIEQSSPIRVVLLKPIEDTTGLQKKTEDLFKFSPKIKGKASYIDAQTFVFTPDEPLDAGTVFTADFRIGDLIELKKELRHFKFQFETERQHLTYSYSSLNSYPNPAMQYLEGTVRLTNKVDVEELEDVLIARLGDKRLNVKWSNNYGNSYQFRIDSIMRREESANLMCFFSGSTIGASEVYNKSYVLRGLADFNISRVETTYEPDQKITINFSDPLDPNQDLNGLITVSNAGKITLQRVSNTVTVFFASRIMGQKQLFISKSVKNYNGYPLVEEHRRRLNFAKPKPKVRMVGKGTIYPMNQTVLFPFETVGLKAVDVRVFKIYDRNVHQFLQVNDLDDNSELRRVGQLIHKGKVALKNIDKTTETQWKRSTLDLSKYIAADLGAIYRVMISFKSSYTFYNCSNSRRDYEADENELYWRYYADNYRINRYTPCQSGYYYRSARTKNIIASQIGLIAKRDRQNQYHLFVNHINTSEPMPNVKLQFFDYQKNVIKEVYTDGSGMATAQLGDEDQPFLLMASSGRQKSYLKLRDGNSNSLSKFQVSGVAPNNEGVKGFIYTERGVWRPGDDIHLAFILEDELGSQYPVKMELFDPNGKLVDKQIKTENTGVIYAFPTKTSSEARTGNYHATVTVGNAKFNRNIKVETVKPNRLKMKLKFEDSYLKSYGLNKGVFSSTWLHGAKAKGLKARIKATVTSGGHPFSSHEGYIFTDPTKSFATQSMIVFEDKLDDQGSTEIEPSFGIKKGAPGFLRVNFVSEVFEKSGNFSTDNRYFPLSPFENYVGLKINDGDLEYGTLVTGQNHPVDLVSVDPTGKTVGNRELEVKVYKMGWSWWWERNRNLTNYVSANNLLPQIEKTLKTNAKGKAQFNLKIDQPQWGRFLVLVQDKVSGHSTGKIVYFDWPYWARKNRANPDNANMLSFMTNKQVYSKGEDVQISIPGAPKGKLLVCVENGRDVLKKFWAEATDGETKISFKATADMNPNVYVHIMGLQDYSKTANDLPVRMYGIMPIRVEDPLTHIYPKIHIKDSIRPDQYEYVSVSEKDGRPMAYTLAIVDEGLLDLTGFKTPDPWNHFNKKEALGIVTWDIYSHVIGAFGQHWGNVLAVGGGDFLRMAKKKPVKANRFKPVVKYFGPYYLNSNEKKQHKFKISNYVGAVKVMVVAANNGAYGNADKSVKVKQPLMVLSTLPRTLSPTEDIEIPVNVFALNKGMGKVKVELKARSGLKIIGENVKSIQMDDIGDEVITFKAKVNNEIGLVKVEVLATSGAEKASHKTEMNIRLPNPEQHKVEEWVVAGGESIKGSMDYFGISGTNSAVVEVSRIPSINLKERLNFLIRYPHGCIEQTTSGAFPQLYLSKLTNMDETQKRTVHRNIEHALFKLNDFQVSDGGFSYWPGGYYVSEWGTTYAGHFMLMAERKGYTISPSMKANWIAHQTRKANSWVPSRYYNAHLQQAYRLYTLALAGKAQLSAMNRLRQESNLSVTAAWKLAGAYALIGRTEIAKQLIAQRPRDIKKYRELSLTFGSSFRDRAMVLETLTLLRMNKDAGKLAIELAKEFGKRQWMSTQETAYGLMALSQYLGKFQTSENIVIAFAANGGASQTIRSADAIHTIKLSKDKNTFTLKNNDNSIVYVKAVNTGVPLEASQEPVASNLSMTVTYKTTDNRSIDVRKLPQGRQFVAEVTVKNPSTHRNLEQLALTQMFPSGWEIQNSRMVGEAFTNPESRFDYRDFRDDRVNTYFPLKAGESKTFRVVLTATYLGKYILPIQDCEAMYDNSVRAARPGQWIEVVPDDGNDSASSD